MLGRRVLLSGAAAILLVVTMTGCPSGGPPMDGDILPTARPSAPLPSAPEDPSLGAHIELVLQVRRDSVAIEDNVHAAKGWAPAESYEQDMRVRLYTAEGDALYETGTADPLSRRVYGDATSSAEEHGEDSVDQMRLVVELPLFASASYVVVAREGRVVLTRDLRADLRRSCATVNDSLCDDWLTQHK